MAIILSGKKKRFKLLTPYSSDKSKEILNIRICSNRLKQGLFSIIKNAIIDAEVLDLYSGIGSLGLEALSQGAANCDFVDISKSAQYYTEQNIKKLQFESRCAFFLMDAKEFVINQSLINKKYRIIFIDPPYNKVSSDEIIDLIKRCIALLENKGIIVVKRNKNLLLPPQIETDEGKVVLDVEKKYASSLIDLYFFDKNE